LNTFFFMCLPVPLFPVTDDDEMTSTSAPMECRAQGVGMLTG